MAVSQVKERIVVDTTSLVCPYPYLQARKVLEELLAGEEFELVTDNEATVVSSVPALERRYHATARVVEEPGRWRVFFRKE